MRAFHLVVGAAFVGIAAVPLFAVFRESRVEAITDSEISCTRHVAKVDSGWNARRVVLLRCVTPEGVCYSKSNREGVSCLPHQWRYREGDPEKSPTREAHR